MRLQWQAISRKKKVKGISARSLLMRNDDSSMDKRVCVRYVRFFLIILCY